jgi:hypothetical protein
MNGQTPHTSDEQFIESCVLATIAAEMAPARLPAIARPSLLERVVAWFRRVFGKGASHDQRADTGGS